jgi:hypothetical protein
MLSNNLSIKLIIATTAVVLMIPLLAMQFTTEVNWSAFDFLIMGSLLLCGGLIFRLVYNSSLTIIYKVALFISLILGFIIIWAQLAVGLFQHSLSGN